MFTGIVKEVIKVTKVLPASLSKQIQTVMLTKPTFDEFIEGDSILLNGICSTITDVAGQQITVEFMQETLEKTTAQNWERNYNINIEAPVTLKIKLSGSLLTGHVDVVGTVKSFTNSKGNVELIISFPKKYQSLVMAKGCISIDGVNLTIVDVLPGACSIKIIPYTLDNTTLHQLQINSKVNIEFDYFAKLTVNHLSSLTV